MDQQQLLIIVGLAAVVVIAVVRTVRGNIRKKLVREKLTAGSTVVDVRTPGEFGGGHYPDAINIPLDKLPKSMKRLGSKSGSIIVYCASGSRSRLAASQLRAAGFVDVINAGGLSSMPR